MTVALVVLVILALAVIGWRVDVLVRRKQAADERLEARRLSIDERKLAIEEARANKTPGDAPEIPPGLLALAEGETEEWAREHIKGRMRELYAETKNWNTVGDFIARELGK